MRRVTIDTPAGLIEGEIDAHSDLDSQFTVHTSDGPVRVNGWMLTEDEIEFMDECGACGRHDFPDDCLTCNR